VIPGESRHLPLDFKTTGNYFKESGRDDSTYFMGKWHLGYRTESLLPTSRGYDYYFGVLGMYIFR
jgi:arylsulfatase A-like enzyme